MAIAISRARLPVGIVLAILLVCLPAVSLSFAADEKDTKVQTLRQTGKQLLDVGYEQYHRGMYDNARETLGKAAAYREYLSVSDASRLDTLLERLSSQPSPDANQVSGRGIEKPAVVPQTEPVITEQRKEPNVIEQPVQTQPQVEQSAVSPEYIEFLPIEANDINRPTQPQIPVMQTEVRPEFITPVPQAEVNEVNYVRFEVNEVNVSEYQQSIQPGAAPISKEQEKESYIEVIKQKQRIQQSYTKAVVNEAVAKAKEYADKEDFLKAKDEISRASAVIEKNKLLLGDTDYAQYKASLQQLLDQINTRQTEIERLKAEKAKAEAQASQEKLRAQQAADRQKRIQDLLTASKEYQEQQRYEEALAQLDTLLAIDPTHREAIRNRQMLEDIINLRRQLEVKKEMGKEEEAVLTDTQRSMIPHADLVTYPRNWQDIVAKRKPEAITVLSPADAAVYKQLETLVDLSALTPDTPLEEAIEIIRSSVAPPLKIVVRWRDLEENAYIERDTVIGMQGLSGIVLRKGLEELLDSVSGGVTKISFVVKDGVITIATTGSLPPTLVTYVYDITDLIAISADFQTQLDLSTLTTAGAAGGGAITAAQGQGVQDTPQNRGERAGNMVTTIQEAIDPMSWLINGGQGTITLGADSITSVSGPVKFVVNQTPQVHEQIQEFFRNIRESLGQQVSIETRFLFVTENFLEDIGLGISNLYIKGSTISSKLTDMVFSFGSSGISTPEKLDFPGNLPSSIDKTGAAPAIELAGGLAYGSILDDLAVSFFLKATQAHRDAKILTAPRFTVLNGERGYVLVGKQVSYISDWEFTLIPPVAQGQQAMETADPTAISAGSGVTLMVRPVISADKKYVDLDVGTNYTKLRLDDFITHSPTGVEYTLQLPTWEPSIVQTRVRVPDGGTLLIGGLKLGAEINKEAGVPALSKVPLLGRLFSARTKTKDQDVLLILVKPTIVLQQESEREYFAPLQ